MCYENNILQQVIDGEYKGDVQQVYTHIEDCNKCRQAFENLKALERFVQSNINQGIDIPPIKEFKLEHQKIKKMHKREGDIFMKKPLNRIIAIAAAAVVCVGLFSFQPVRTYASDFLKIFRVNEVKGIAINQRDFSEIEKIFHDGQGKVNIQDLVSMKVSSQDKRINSKEVTDYNDIKKEVPFAQLVKPILGLEYLAFDLQPEADLSLKLNVPKINDLLNYLGEDTKLPEKLNQEEFKIHSGNILNYHLVTPREAENTPEEYKGLSVTQMDAPTLQIPEGVNENELIDALFSLRIVPDTVKKQLGGLKDITSTLPVPYDSQRQIKKDITIQGHKGIVLQLKDNKYKRNDIVFKSGDKLFVINSTGLTLEEVVQILETME